MVLGKFTKEALKANVKVHAKFILNFFLLGPLPLIHSARERSITRLKGILTEFSSRYEACGGLVVIFTRLLL